MAQLDIREAQDGIQEAVRQLQKADLFTDENLKPILSTGVPYMYVTISGKDSRGQRYGTKGFVLNYGRRTGGKIPADYYWSNAVQATWKRVNEAMTDKAAEIINSNR